MARRTVLDSRLWKLLCSLKLTIVLASLATLLAVGGSVLMPFNPAFFDLDSMPLGQWLNGIGRQHLELTWWIPAGGVVIVLLGVNTLCCFVDWLFHIRTRWRKAGEYFIHLGFVLILCAFLWGSQTGFRSEKKRCPDGAAADNKAVERYCRAGRDQTGYRSSGKTDGYLDQLGAVSGWTLTQTGSDQSQSSLDLERSAGDPVLVWTHHVERAADRLQFVDNQL